MNMRPMGGLIRPPKTPTIIKPPIMSGNIKPPTTLPGYKPPFTPMAGLVSPPTQKPTQKPILKDILDKIGELAKNKKVKIAAGITAGAATIATIGTIIANKIKK